ncbi:tRNA (guanine(37)-N(1))-methyltransferase [Bacteriovorax sp. BSW11_IV]|uniref:tRNA (guanosine(37)-N1)-methyltransferase TrmD n=1 Tax=Bacteriovorax sp. BSW11_IV TaxID=1353529 RepID=UPI00038A41B9|nr:tRNA (guanosine(37)-N1)-methyltransferase TrmD [Bacteriovorax sp. BSW11_IV]EQC49341.1 tRNA (guanine(37)-N(1))-methyltransferase [Bacteriovorax sp. BSW11_IV]
MSRIWIITLFPEYFAPLKDVGVAGQALQGMRGEGIELHTVLLRDYSPKGHKGVDDAPYGGGPGMVMRADVLKNALMEGIVGPGQYGENFKDKLHVIYTGPRGKVWNNEYCKDLAGRYLGENKTKDLVFICGRYEGIDERFLEEYVDETICLGDFVLTGGEIPVMAIIDSAMRFSKGVLGNNESANLDSFEDGLLEHAQYTRPMEFDGKKVPEVLLSGHHKNIELHRQKEKEYFTKKFRPDLYEKYKDQGKK